MALSLTAALGEAPLCTAFSDNIVLLHSKLQHTSVASVSAANFAPGVYKAMNKKFIKQVYRTQSYAWPHLMNPTHSLLVVNGPSSGQTWCYLPALCTHVYNRLMQQGRKQGTIAIVLTAGSRQAEYVTKACMLLLENNCKHDASSYVVAAYAGQNNRDIRVALNNGCGILVATPAQLAQLFKQNEIEKFFVPDTLQHVVIDDFHLIHAQNKSECNQLILKLFKVGRVRNGKQFVITSRFWIQESMPKIVQLINAPLLIFGDFLEAFVYAGAELNIRLFESARKDDLLLDFLDRREHAERTVIFCATDRDVQILCEKLKKINYDCLMYLQNADIEVQDNVKQWKSGSSTNQLLICTDNCPEIQVQNAKYLIHYTMANSWSKFTMRFATMSKNYRNALAACTPNEPVKSVLKSLILLDEQNEPHLSRLVEFLLQHNFDVDPKIIAVAGQYKSKMSLKNSKNILCSNFATFADCDISSCTARHVFNNDDMVPYKQISDIPKDGVVNVDILKVYTPSHFAVRLREHRADNSTEWRKLPQSSTYFCMACKLTTHFSDPKNRIIHWPPVQHEICIVEMQQCYYRVRIIYVPEIKQTNIVRHNVKVGVQFMDLNTDESEYNALNLFDCPREFQDVPATAINMRILGIVPCDNERLWLLRDTNLVKTKLLKNITKQEQVHCPIEFSFLHTIFVRNLFALEYMPFLKLRVYRINMRQLIIDNKIGVKDSNIAEKLHALFKAIPSVDDGDDNANYDSDDSFVTCKDKDEVDDVDYDDFNGALHQKTSFDSDFDGENSNSLRVTETWCELLFNEPIKIEIPQQNNNWAGFYCKPITELHIKQFEKLQQLISAHINSENSIRILAIEECQLEENYLVKNNLHDFVRAKLLSFIAKKYYRFWLYDYCAEHTITYTNDNLYDPNQIFKCPRELTQALPYQSIYCKLADISPNCKENIKTEKSHLYAIAKRELEQDLNCTLNNLSIRKYEILLYETDCETVDPVAVGVLFNERLNVKKPVEQDATKIIIEALLNFDKDDEDTALFVKSLLRPDKYNNNNHNGMTEAYVSKIKNKETLEETEDAKNNSTTKLCKSISKHGLHYSTRPPQVSWYQDLAYIKIIITISDNTNYIVKCDERQFFYATQPPKESFRLQLLHSVQLESNRMCGLRVYIVLRKQSFKIWRSLLETVDKNIKLPWLTYNLEHIDERKSFLMRVPDHKVDVGYDYETSNDISDEEEQPNDDIDLEYDDKNEYPSFY